MDGLLVNTEPFWRQVEREIFSRFDLHLTEEMLNETFGLQTKEVIQHWYRYKPWPNLSYEALEEEFQVKIMKLIKTKGKLMDGVEQTIQFFRKKEILLGIASSSTLLVIEKILDLFDLKKVFDVYHTSEDEDYGKPHPAVYITTAQRLGVKPFECVAFEDSFNGLISAKAARMKAVVVPDGIHQNDPGYGIADLMIRSLADFNEKHLEYLNSL